MPKRGSSSYISSYNWSLEADALLATMPGADVRARLGINREIVWRRRHLLGIAVHSEPYRPRFWSDEERRLLGHLLIRDLAQSLGTTTKTVRRAR
jgi:hypothetical protein